MIKRIINIEKKLKPGKVLIIYGPRQVGKTTLIKEYLKSFPRKYIFKTGDDLIFANDFSQCSLAQIIKMVPENTLFVIDEAQKIQNIGRALKLVVDNIANVTVLVTGSSSFDLANKTGESLTGRKIIQNMYPISLKELSKHLTFYDLNQKLPDFLIYGMYPEPLTLSTTQEKIEKITEISNSYLLKDILDFDMIKNSKTIIDLLKMIAFQIGSEVSVNELSRNLGVDKKTVARYLDLLEKSFVLFRLNGFSRNLRKEITKMSKYYFFDLGTRNALISNFNNLNTRNDVGQLWENFIMIERIKINSYYGRPVNYYFWRTYDKKEIDLIEEREGKLFGYEFKWKKEKSSSPKDFLKAYSEAQYHIINSENYQAFLS
jgi:uncharacterized protein